jgi:hypothetical protein
VNPKLRKAAKSKKKAGVKVFPIAIAAGNPRRNKED